jgi:hypothetical protein
MMGKFRSRASCESVIGVDVPGRLCRALGFWIPSAQSLTFLCEVWGRLSRVFFKSSLRL